MKRAKYIALSIVLLAGMAHLDVQAEQGNASATCTARVYELQNLPAYFPRAGKPSLEFDPAVLIAHIKNSIDPASWDGDASIDVFTQNLSMVVIQTEENLTRIAKLLESFRRGEERK